MENRFENFTSLILNINRYIQKIKNIEMEEFGLKGNQVQCLYYLNNNDGGLSFTSLCQLCGEDKAAISRTLKELESHKLVEVLVESDKKYKNPIKLTAEGKRISSIISKKINNFLELGSKGISEAERTKLYSTLERIAKNLKNIYNTEE